MNQFMNNIWSFVFTKFTEFLHKITPNTIRSFILRFGFIVSTININNHFIIGNHIHKQVILNRLYYITMQSTGDVYGICLFKLISQFRNSFFPSM